MPSATTTPTPTATASATEVLPTGSGVVSGTIRQSLNDNLVPSAEVFMEVAAGHHTVMTTTTASGAYLFSQVAEQTWIIEPSLTGELDGSVNATDAAVVLSAAAGDVVLTVEQATAADVTGDGSVSSTDASLILQRATTLISTFPVADVCKSDWVFFPDAAEPPPFVRQTITQPQVSSTACIRGSITLEPVIGDVDARDFTAVAFGDVDSSWASVRAGEGATIEAIEIGRPWRRGDSILVPLELKKPHRFRGLHLMVDYDSEVAAFVAVRPAAEVKPALVVANEIEIGRLLIAAASGTAVDDEEPIILEFTSVRPGAYPELTVVEVILDPF